MPNTVTRVQINNIMVDPTPEQLAAIERLPGADPLANFYTFVDQGRGRVTGYMSYPGSWRKRPIGRIQEPVILDMVLANPGIETVFSG